MQKSSRSTRMPFSHTHSVTVMNDDDDDDDHICPVCDGECTCLPSSSSLLPPLPIQSSSSSSSKPSLKIKLTLPPSILSKRRQLPPKPSTSTLPKRRGRPPKSIHTSLPLPPSKSFRSVRPKVLPKGKPKKSAALAPTKRKRVVTSSGSSSSSSSSSDVDPSSYTNDDDDAQSGRFPTFLSASALSSLSSNDSDDLSSGFETDSSIEAEEEQFILSQESRQHDKARLRRELMGDETQKKRVPQNDWVIRPRKKSVGPDDPDMDVDTDATEDEDDNEEEDEDDGADEEDETDGTSTGAGYVGVATSWSDDEESSFDADLFFANLSDTEGDHDRSSASSDEAGDDGDQSDLDGMSMGETTPSSSMFLPRIRTDLQNLPFEVTEGWDGQIVFTNGLPDGQSILDIDFEVAAAAHISVDSTSSSSSQDSDFEMFSAEADEQGYEEDLDGGEGDTTDEELVGEDDLPNERAMKLFHLPPSISSINPMSTMSPAVSPGPRDRKPFVSPLDSPKPADILAGKLRWGSNEPDDLDLGSASKSRSISSSRGGLPRTGHFEPILETRRVIIDGTNKEIPSPHPRFRGRGKAISRLGRFSQLEHSLRKHLASSNFLPSNNPFQHVPSDDLDTKAVAVDMPPTTPIDLDEVLEASFLDPDPSVEPESATCPEASDSDAHMRSLHRWDVISVSAFRQTRDNDEAPSGSWATVCPPNTPGSPNVVTDYGSIMKSSPLSAMMWPTRKAGRNRRKAQKRKYDEDITGASESFPLVIPLIPGKDGDRTPTGRSPPVAWRPNVPPPQHQQQQQKDGSKKTRKELRREKRMKRKGYPGVPQHSHQHQYSHHFHQHHPNSKTRSTSSVQRFGGSGFAGSGSPASGMGF